MAFKTTQAKRWLSAAAALLMLFPLCASGTVSHNTTGIVRVGYNMENTDYMQVSKNGDLSGYYYEYMEELAKFAGWRCEYVPLPSWSSCISSLASGEVDIISPVKYTPERAQTIYFPAMSMGKSCSALVTLPSKDGEANRNGFDGVRVGTVRNNLNGSRLKSYAEKNGIELTYVEFPDETSRNSALESGRVDAIVTNNLIDLSKFNVLFTFDVEPFYCGVNINNTELIDELEEAVSMLEMYNPSLTLELYEKHFGDNRGVSVSLTEQEREYLDGLGTIRVSVTPATPPLSWFEHGEAVGVIPEIMRDVLDGLDTPYEFVEVASYEEALQLTRSGEIDILCDFGGDYSWAKHNNLKFTTAYMDCMYSMVIRDGGIHSENSRIGFIKGYYVNNIVQSENPSAEYFYYDDEIQCFDAISRGDLDAGVISTYVAEHLIGHSFSRMTSVLIKNYSSRLAIAMSKNTDPIFLNILNKQILNIKSNRISEILESYRESDEHDVGLLELLYRNPVTTVWFVLALLAVAACVVYLILRNRRIYSRHIFELAYVDKLTGCWNSQYIEERAPMLMLRFAHNHFAMLSLDISSFSLINESYGRAIGDEVIKYVALQLRDYGADGLVARVKADHFMLLVSYGSQQELDDKLARLRHNINRFSQKGLSIKLVLNIGICLIRRENDSITSIIDMAEMARREAKSGTSKAVYFDDFMEKRLKREKEIEDCMASSLAKHEFEVYYQPKFNINTGAISGAEALVRWNNPQRGFMNPAEFIPIFERNGFIIELDGYVLDQSFALQRRLLDVGSVPVPISVNQSRVNFSDEHYLERLQQPIEKYKLPAGLIELEITETAFINQERLVDSFKYIKSMGYAISVDDYGAEYSSPGMLRRSELDAIKIDRSFLMETQMSERSKIIVRKTVEMAHELGLEVICEGVELIEQVDFLKSIGCNFAQGFYFARPMPEEKFLDCLHKQRVTH